MMDFWSKNLHLKRKKIIPACQKNVLLSQYVLETSDFPSLQCLLQSKINLVFNQVFPILHYWHVLSRISNYTVTFKLQWLTLELWLYSYKAMTTHLWICCHNWFSCKWCAKQVWQNDVLLSYIMLFQYCNSLDHCISCTWRWNNKMCKWHCIPYQGV